MHVAAIAGWIGVISGVVMTLAQAVRVRREGTDGVSATTWSLFGLMAIFWLAWGYSVSSPEVLIGTAAGIPLLIWLYSMLAPKALSMGMARGALAVVVLVWAPTIFLGWHAGLIGIGILMVLTRAPQLLDIVRLGHAHGVSVASWLIGSASLATWLVYYAGSGEGFAAVSMALALSMNLAVVTAALRCHRAERSRAELVAA